MAADGRGTLKGPISPLLLSYAATRDTSVATFVSSKSLSVPKKKEKNTQGKVNFEPPLLDSSEVWNIPRTNHGDRRYTSLARAQHKKHTRVSNWHLKQHIDQNRQNKGTFYQDRGNQKQDDQAVLRSLQQRNYKLEQIQINQEISKSSVTPMNKAVVAMKNAADLSKQQFIKSVKQRKATISDDVANSSTSSSTTGIDIYLQRATNDSDTKASQTNAQNSTINQNNQKKTKMCEFMVDEQHDQVKELGHRKSVRVSAQPDNSDFMGGHRKSVRVSAQPDNSDFMGGRRKSVRVSPQQDNNEFTSGHRKSVRVSPQQDNSELTGTIPTRKRLYSTRGKAVSEFQPIINKKKEMYTQDRDNGDLAIALKRIRESTCKDDQNFPIVSNNDKQVQGTPKPSLRPPSPEWNTTSKAYAHIQRQDANRTIYINAVTSSTPTEDQAKLEARANQEGKEQCDMQQRQTNPRQECDMIKASVKVRNLPYVMCQTRGGYLLQVPLPGANKIKGYSISTTDGSIRPKTPMDQVDTPLQITRNKKPQQRGLVSGGSPIIAGLRPVKELYGVLCESLPQLESDEGSNMEQRKVLTAMTFLDQYYFKAQGLQSIFQNRKSGTQEVSTGSMSRTASSKRRVRFSDIVTMVREVILEFRRQGLDGGDEQSSDSQPSTQPVTEIAKELLEVLSKYQQARDSKPARTINFTYKFDVSLSDSGDEQDVEQASEYFDPQSEYDSDEERELEQSDCFLTQELSNNNQIGGGVDHRVSAFGDLYASSGDQDEVESMLSLYSQKRQNITSRLGWKRLVNQVQGISQAPKPSSAEQQQMLNMGLTSSNVLDFVEHESEPSSENDGTVKASMPKQIVDMCKVWDDNQAEEGEDRMQKLNAVKKMVRAIVIASQDTQVAEESVPQVEDLQTYPKSRVTSMKFAGQSTFTLNFPALQTPDSLFRLQNQLRNSPWITELLIPGETRFTGDFTQYLQKVLTKASIATLILQRWKKPGMEIISAITQALQWEGQRCTLKRLKLECCTLQDAEIQAFCSAFEVNKSLKTVEILNCNFSLNGMKNIHYMIEINDTLSSLDLSGTPMSTVTMDWLIEALSQSGTLAELHLKNCGITDDHINKLGACLRQNQSLKHLSLAHNHITHVGAHGIAAGISDCTSLLRIGLEYNPIGYRGGRHIVESVLFHEHLEEWHLQGCSLFQQDYGWEYYSVKHPNGIYLFDLSAAEQRSVANDILWNVKNGQLSFSNEMKCFLNGSEFDTAASTLPKELPGSGVLRVQVLSESSVQPPKQHVTEYALKNILRELNDDRNGENWKLQFIHLLGCFAVLKIEQACQIVKVFQTASQRVKIAALLLRCVSDIENIVQFGKPCFNVNEENKIYQELGLSTFCNSNPVGYYDTQLSRQTHRLIVMRLLHEQSKIQGSTSEISCFKRACLYEDDGNFNQNYIVKKSEVGFDGRLTFDFIAKDVKNRNLIGKNASIRDHQFNALIAMMCSKLGLKVEQVSLYLHVKRAVKAFKKLLNKRKKTAGDLSDQAHASQNAQLEGNASVANSHREQKSQKQASNDKKQTGKTVEKVQDQSQHNKPDTNEPMFHKFNQISLDDQKINPVINTTRIFAGQHLLNTKQIGTLLCLLPKLQDRLELIIASFIGLQDPAKFIDLMLDMQLPALVCRQQTMGQSQPIATHKPKSAKSSEKQVDADVNQNQTQVKMNDRESLFDALCPVDYRLSISKLLQICIDRVGYEGLRITWSTDLTGIRFKANLKNFEELQFLNRVCRFNDLVVSNNRKYIANLNINGTDVDLATLVKQRQGKGKQSRRGKAITFELICQLAYISQDESNDKPYYVSFDIETSVDHVQGAAIQMVQSSVRGYRVRKRMFRTIREQSKNRWIAEYQSYKFKQTIQSMRKMGAQLFQERCRRQLNEKTQITIV